MAKKKSDEGGKKPLRQVNVRLANDLYARVERTADALGLDVAQFLRMVIKKHLPRYEKEAEGDCAPD